MKVCNKCGGLKATENLEMIAGTICKCPVEPEVKLAACENCEKYFRHLLNWIKDDIEFGYTSEMIYNKIKNKNYRIENVTIISKPSV